MNFKAGFQKWYSYKNLLNDATVLALWKKNEIGGYIVSGMLQQTISEYLFIWCGKLLGITIFECSEERIARKSVMLFYLL